MVNSWGRIRKACVRVSLLIRPWEKVRLKLCMALITEKPVVRGSHTAAALHRVAVSASGRW
jgi:hypothetical protein